MYGFFSIAHEGVGQDKPKAVQWYRKASEQGLVDAQNKMGVKYFYSEDVEKKHSKAIKCYRKSADTIHIIVRLHN